MARSMIEEDAEDRTAEACALMLEALDKRRHRLSSQDDQLVAAAVMIRAGVWRDHLPRAAEPPEHASKGRAVLLAAREAVFRGAPSEEWDAAFDRLRGALTNLAGEDSFVGCAAHVTAGLGFGDAPLIAVTIDVSKPTSSIELHEMHSTAVALVKLHLFRLVLGAPILSLSIRAPVPLRLTAQLADAPEPR